MSDSILIGKGGQSEQRLLLRYANRHGLIAGATGTGKTVSLQVLAEGFSALGVPVFAADIKGDLAGISQPGELKPKLVARAQLVGLDGYAPQACPSMCWDVFGQQGHPVRSTVSDLGPLLFSRLLELSDVQEAVLSLVFKYADDQGLLLLDLKDLRALLQHVADNAKTLGADYGLVSAASVGAIQRGLVGLQQEGGEPFFGEPALELADLMRVDLSGRGIVSLLAADQLYLKPRLYATFMLALLGELFEELPEAGDLDKPKLVFFFDEAHLLFKDAPKALVDKIEQVVRLIRSKGVGVWFVTQNPLDLPDAVLGQLGNRIQHALRAFTPREQKAVRAAADTFRGNPVVDVAEAITQLGVGEALVSTLQDGGVPGMVEKTLICPPASRIGPVMPAERATLMQRSPVAGRYERLLDRESAFELLGARAAQTQRDAQHADAWNRDIDRAQKSPQRSPPTRPAPRGRQSVGEAAVKSVVRSVSSSVGREIGRQLIRGVFGTLLRR